MNALAESRPATPDEIDMAADVVIPASELKRVWQERQRERAREERRARRNAATKTGTNLVQLAVIGAMATAIVSMMPLVRVEPIFVYLRDDGTMITSRSWADVPAATREAFVKTTLAEYVSLREGYASGEADIAWTRVSALSTKPVRQQFQEWYHRDSKDSPQRLYGDRITVRVDVTDVQQDATIPDAYRVYFTATKRSDGRVIETKNMLATLRVKAADAKQLPWGQRINFNPAAIQVWEYPGARTLSTPGGRS